MEESGVLQGLSHKYGDPVDYAIALANKEVSLNSYLGKSLRMEFLGEIECIACGRKINKTYNRGYCYPCFRDLAINDLCIVKPHECHFDQGTCREEDFGEKYCMIPHYVYLSLSSDVKVGLTRKNNEIKRWIDQGAVKGILIAELPTRKMAGELEFYLSSILPDKTNWRKMLRGDYDDADLLSLRDEVQAQFPEQYKPYMINNDDVTEITYPEIEKVKKLTSFNLDKNPHVEGELIGIKGQYLLFKNGVINMRKYAGYHMKVAVDE